MPSGISPFLMLLIIKNGKSIPMGKTSKILIIPFTPTLSHLSRPLEIAKALDRRGHEVIFAGHGSLKSKLKFAMHEGFECRFIYEPDPDDVFNNIRQGKLAFVSSQDLLRMISDDMRLIAAVKPDLVLTDGRFSAMISTQLSNVSHAAIVNASSTEYRALPYIPFLNDALVARGGKVFQKCYNRFNLSLEMAIFNNGMPYFSRLTKKYKLKKPVNATNCLAGKDLTLLADIPEYFPLSTQPDNYHYIGPVTWKRSEHVPMPNWWPPDENGNALLYITMGTTGQGDLFSKLYSEVIRSNHQSVITTGKQHTFKSIPDKIYVEDYLDGDRVIEKADIVICHGGNGTIYQALALGKPIIGIPTIPDQAFNMRRVEAMGVGISLSMNRVLKTPSIIMDAVNRIIREKDRFNTNLERTKQLLQAYNSTSQAADIIESLLLAQHIKLS